MTRKEYEAIAASVKRSLELTIHSEGRVSLLMFVSEFCTAAAESNPRFDAVKFQVACGF